MSRPNEIEVEGEAKAVAEVKTPAVWTRRIAIAVLAVMALLAITWWGLRHFGNEAHIDVTREELQQRLSAKFPVRNCALTCVELSEPVIGLTEGSDRISFSTNTLVNLGRLQLPGRLAFSGKLRYVRYEGNFFFEQIEIQEFQLSGLPPALAGAVRAHGESLIGAVLSSVPVYSIKDDSPNAALARQALRDVQVVDGKLRIRFLRFGG